MRITDLCGICGKYHVAEQSERCAQPDGMAVHPADNGLVDVEQGEDDCLGHFNFMVE